MREEIYSIPGKVVGHHDTELNAIIDTWSSMLVSLEEFKETIYDYGVLDYAPKAGVTIWVVETSSAQSVFKSEVQSFIESTVAPKCVEIGIKYFFIVLPQTALGKLSAKKVSKINGEQKGMQTIEVGSFQEIEQLLKEVKVI